METRYEIDLRPKYEPLQLIDIPAEVAASSHPWSNRTLAAVNESVVRLGIVEGEFHWHKHDAEDELFLVLEGRLLIDVADGDTIELGPHQAVTIPKGVVHRPRAPERTVVVMVETATVVPTGDA